MHFEFSFISNVGELSDKMWLTGDLFSSLINHKNEKKKYFYDATIFRKNNWMSLDVFHSSGSTHMNQSQGDGELNN